MLDPIKKGPWLGINNRLEGHQLNIPGTGSFVADAVNVELTDVRSFRRRDVETRLEAMNGAHSLFKASNGHTFLVRDSVLYRITLPTYSETLLKLLTSDAPVSYVEYAGSVYYSNGTDSGRIDAGVWYPMALPTPSAPTLSAISGSLAKGQYRVAVSYINSTTGEEGGLSAASAIDLADGAGIHVVLPGVASGASHVAIYLSKCNGSVLLYKSMIDQHTSTIDISTEASGREGVQRFEAPLPAGELFLFNGCLCSFSAGNVYEGIPYRPGYYLPVEGRIPFPADVSNVIPAQNGVYVVADITRWFSGPRMTQADNVVDVLPYGGVPGTAFVADDKKSILYGWMGARGLVIAGMDGSAISTTEQNVDLDAPERGSSVVLTTRGVRRVVSCGWCVNLQNYGVTRFADFDFNSFIDGYGLKDDGLYALTGGSSLDAHIDLGNDDFGTDLIKKMPYAYLAVASEAPIRITVTVDDDQYEYESDATSGAMEMRRFKFGRGLKHTWFGLTISNTEGANFSLDSVEFYVVPTPRRILS